MIEIIIVSIITSIELFVSFCLCSATFISGKSYVEAMGQLVKGVCIPLDMLYRRISVRKYYT